MALSDDIMGKGKQVVQSALQGALFVGILASIVALSLTAVPWIWVIIGHIAAHQGLVGLAGHVLQAGLIGGAAGGAFFGALKLFPSLRTMGNFFKSNLAPHSSPLSPAMAPQKQQDVHITVDSPVQQQSPGSQIINDMPAGVEGRKPALSAIDMAKLGDAKGAGMGQGM